MNDAPILRSTTKILAVLRNDLLTWQKLNVTAFLISGIAHTQPDSIGEPYEDGSETAYLPMFGEPVMVYEASQPDIPKVLAKAISREVTPSIYTEELFTTGNDIDNRAAVKAVNHENLNLVGIAFRCDRKIADKIVKGLKLHS